MKSSHRSAKIERFSMDSESLLIETVLYEKEALPRFLTLCWGSFQWNRAMRPILSRKSVLDGSFGLVVLHHSLAVEVAKATTLTRPWMLCVVNFRQMESRNHYQNIDGRESFHLMSVAIPWCSWWMLMLMAMLAASCSVVSVVYLLIWAVRLMWFCCL